MQLSVQNCKKPTVGMTLPSRPCSSPGIVVLWVAALPRRPGGTCQRLQRLLYSLPVIEAILMPVMMAVLASRLWDMEIKGNTTKLLYTAEPPQPVCRQSCLWGAGSSSGHGAGAGLRSGAGARSWLYRSLSHWAAMLSVRLHTGGGRNALLWRISADAVGSNPLPALCVGIVGALVGLFSAFMPPLVSYFVPLGTTSR